jgi:thioester reductase-like protein
VRRPDGVLVTGATGLLGRHLLRRLIRDGRDRHLYVLVRDRSSWTARAAAEGWPSGRVTALTGDVTLPGAGLAADARSVVARRVGTVVHCAADTVFSRPLSEARRVNTRGTEHVLELASDCTALQRFLHVSTAFVAGRRTGPVLEEERAGEHGFVNGYEQSKAEAEAAVRATALPWAVVRPSAVVCDGPSGTVGQLNAVHRALRLYHGGLASMMPGEEENPVDLVSADWVADCIAAVMDAAGVERGVFHACSGERALRLGTLLDEAYAVWSESPAWRRRAIPRPALTDLRTYRLFERTVEQTGDERLRAITRSLSHFVPQLALPKWFDTGGMASVMGRPPPPPAAFWPHVIRHLIRSRWAADARRAA